MAKRRTKKDKIIAQLRREVRVVLKSETDNNSESYKIKTKSILTKKPLIPSEKEGASVSLFSYDTNLIRKDLKKTVMLTIVMFLVEFGIYFFIS